MPAECCKNKWPQIPEDEPVFVLRGKDLLVLPVIAKWIDLANANGVNEDKMVAVQRHYDAIAEFQSEYPERCKIPD